MTEHVAATVPICLNVCVVEIDPGLPAFFRTVSVVPSPNVNNAPFIYPSGSMPLQVNVAKSDGIVPREGFTESPVQVGTVFSVKSSCVGVGVDVGLDAGVGVGVGVDVGSDAGVGVGVGVSVGVTVLVVVL